MLHVQLKELPAYPDGSSSEREYPMLLPIQPQEHSSLESSKHFGCERGRVPEHHPPLLLLEIERPHLESERSQSGW